MSDTVMASLDRLGAKLDDVVKQAQELIALWEAMRAKAELLRQALARITEHDGDGMLTPVEGDDVGPSGLLSDARLARHFVAIIATEGRGEAEGG